jgi:glycosyltransferase involved in cell wall biosynthesis
MRIAVDFKVISTDAAVRGMGRYTQQQLRELLAHDSDVEVFLLSHGPAPAEHLLADWTSFSKVHTIPVTVDGHDLDYTKPPDFATVLAYSHRLQQLLKRLSIDVFHNTVPFMSPYYSSISVCPVVTTFYDAIPLIYPSDYFTAQEQRTAYFRSMANVIASERVIAISQSAANDLWLYTGYSKARIHIGYPIIESTFRPIPVGTSHLVSGSDTSADPIQAVLSNLPAHFILSVTGIHRAKNISVLLEAFREASSELDQDWVLVVLLPSEFAHTVFAQRFGSPPRVITLHDVTDDQLCRLYNSATLVVQPSAYEGFGYPVAEAMSCGAAVITTDSSSLPEIAGNAALLVPPSDAQGMASAIVHLARDQELRNELKARALMRSAQFNNPQALAATTLDAYRSAIGLSGRKGSGECASVAVARPRIAVWSSMPPLDCGVADYSAELIDTLAETHDVSVYVDGSYSPTPSQSPYIRFRHPSDYTSDNAPAPNVFQVAARNYQEFMYPYIRLHGGTIVVHDLSIGIGFYWLAKAGDSINTFEDEVLWPEGLTAVVAYARLGLNVKIPSREVMDRFFNRFKMLGWLFDRSDRVLVNTDPLRQTLLKAYPEAKVGVARTGVADQVHKYRYLPRQAYRKAMGLDNHGICIGCFGIVDRSKRIGVVIKAFAALCVEHPTSLLLIAGRCYELGYKEELRVQIVSSGVADRIIMLDYVGPRAFHALVNLVDVLVTLRDPGRNGLSAVLVRGLAAGRPVITSAIEEWQVLPEGTCRWVEPGENEYPQLLEHLRMLAKSRSLRDRDGLAARRWFLENATLYHMAADYVSQIALARGALGFQEEHLRMSSQRQ